ncbi:MAG: LysR substrate-binding domain-containing protein [Janthinobacterium lividum]
MRQIPSFFALRAFEAAARLESFVLASEELHLTPSAISHQVRALEEHFGRLLFVRRNRQVEPTADGQHLLRRLTRTFDALEAACAEVGRASQAQTLAVHCAPSFASKWLGPRLPLFMQDHPEISIRLSSGAEPVDLARQEGLDLVVAYGKAVTRRGLVVEPLGVEQVAALATPGLDMLFDLSLPASLSRLTLIESVLSPVRWPDWFALNRLSPLPADPVSRPSFDRGALAVSAAVQGLGVALESTRFAQDEIARGELVLLGGHASCSVSRELHFLCYRASQRDLPKILVFRAWLLETLGLKQTGI